MMRATGGSLQWLALVGGMLALLVQPGSSSHLTRQHGGLDHVGSSHLVRISAILPDWSTNCKLALEALFAYGELQVAPVTFDWLLVFAKPGHHSHVAGDLARLELPKKHHELGYVYRHGLLNKYCKKLGENRVLVNDTVPVALQIFYTMIKLDRRERDAEKTLPEDFDVKVGSCVQFLEQFRTYNWVHNAVDMIEAAKDFEMTNYKRHVTNRVLCTRALRHVLGNSQLTPLKY